MALVWLVIFHKPKEQEQEQEAARLAESTMATFQSLVVQPLAHSLEYATRPLASIRARASMLIPCHDRSYSVLYVRFVGALQQQHERGSLQFTKQLEQWLESETARASQLVAALKEQELQLCPQYQTSPQHRQQQPTQLPHTDEGMQFYHELAQEEERVDRRVDVSLFESVPQATRRLEFVHACWARIRLNCSNGSATQETASQELDALLHQALQLQQEQVLADSRTLSLQIVGELVGWMNGSTDGARQMNVDSRCCTRSARGEADGYLGIDGTQVHGRCKLARCVALGCRCSTDGLFLFSFLLTRCFR